MGQRVEFIALPGTRYDQYVFKLRAIFAAVQQPGGTQFKAFRDALRKLGVWDKERAAGMLSLVDLSWDKKTVKLGPLAAKLHATTDDEAFRKLLYERLVDANILLVKYVFEALDVEAGGRLHSVHELYRMITSYVYPGEYVTLENFKAWMEWIAATGYLKLVGIRWALGEPGLAALPELKGMDVEEILEDLADEAEAEAGEAPEVEAPETVEPAAPVVAEPAGDEEWADLPPEPELPSDADVEAAERAFMERFADVPEDEEPGPAASPAPPPARRPAAPARANGGLHPPLPGTSRLPITAVIGADDDTKALAARIVGWWEALNDWPTYTAADLGVLRTEDRRVGDVLKEIVLLSLVVEGLTPLPQVFVFVTRLREAGQLDACLGGEVPLVELATAATSDPWTRPLVERLVHVQPALARLGDADAMVERLAGCASGREAVQLLYREVFAEAWIEAPFWTLREAIRLHLLEDGPLASAAVVPTARLLANATRIGLCPRPQAASFAELISVAEAAAALFGPDAGFGEPLELLDRALGLVE